MNFHVDGKYSAFEELMYYYHVEFFVYYLLVLIVFLNCFKAIVKFNSIKRHKVSNISLGYFDLFISMIAGMGLGTGMFFQGILSDISSKYFKIWGNKMFALCVVAFILFIVQLIFTVKTENFKENGNEK
jgi:di/tricarboxylate transporter